MAVAFDGFSIRDYTSKMRSIDVFKCWPFRTDEVSREDVESWLPPMDVPKPSCCSSELEASRSDRDDDEKPLDEEISRSESVQLVKSEERLEMVCPVCRVFNAATLTAVNAHIDGCLAQTMREERRQMKSKSKAPKKRSIAEIFEVQEQEERPKIETVLKFWPFRENPDEVSITVTKFKWWSRQLEAMRSNKVGSEVSGNDSECVKSNASAAAEEEKLEMVCPVCRDFNAATVTAVNAHIDSCLAQAMREERRQMKMNLKPKPKAPKKRSIAEILTVAPQIQATDSEVVEVDTEEEDEDEEEEEEEENKKEEKYDYGSGNTSGVGAVVVISTIRSKNNINRRKKKRVKKPKRKSKEENYRVESLNNGKKMVMNKKKKKKKNNELIAKKEDASKHKVQTPVNNPRKLRGTIGIERVALDDIDTTVHKKKSSLKSFSAEKKQKVKISDSVGKQQKAVPPVRGILKNHSESDCNIEEGTEDSHCDVQVITSDRHVRFSGKDDILGQKRRDSPDENMFNLSSDAMATSLGKQSSESEEAAILVNRSDDNIAINMNKRKEGCPIVEDDQFSRTPEQVAGQYFLRACNNQEKSKHLVEKPESLSHNNNLDLFDRGNTTTVHYSTYAGIPRTLCALQPGEISSLNTQICDSGAFSSTVKFVDHWKNPTHQASAVNSNASTRIFLEPSSSYSTSYSEANERPQLQSQIYGDCDNNGQALGDRPLSHIFSAGMVDNSFSLPGWGKGSVRNNCLDESIVGLPLNSHGELINFSSSGKVGVNQLQASSTSRVSSCGLLFNNIVSQSRQEYLSINERDFVHQKDCEDPFPHYPARLGVTEFQSIEKADIHRPSSDSSSTSNHFAHPLDSELNLMRNSFNEQNQHNHAEKHKGNQMMYLDESSDPVSLSSSQPTMRLMGKDVPISRSSEEMKQIVELEDAWAGEVSRRRHCFKDAALENSFLGRCSEQNLISGSPSQISTENVSRSVKIHGNQASQSNCVSQNGSLGVSRNASSYLLPIAQAHTSCVVYNRAPHDLPKQFISEAKPLGLSPQLQAANNPCNFTQPSFGFPFLNPNAEKHAQASWFQRSSRSLPPWLLSSTHEKLPGTPQQFSGLSCKSFPHSKWGENITVPPVNHSAVVYHPNPLTSHCQIKTTLCPASIVQPPHVPLTSVTKPSFSINSGHKNVITFADRVKLDDMNIEDHRYRNAKKRPAANLDDSSSAIVLPNIEVQENLSCMSGLTRENRSAEMQRNTRAVELDSHGDSAGRKYCRQNEAQSIHPRSYPGMESFKSDGMVSSGPVRLSPGAKHILIPSQNMEHDNSRLIHSTIPIAATTDRGRDLEIQKNLTKIYRL